MAVISNTSLALTTHMNTTFVNSFVPRSNEWVWNHIYATLESNTANEPFAILGAAPYFEVWRRFTNNKPIPSFTMNVPNMLMKASAEISRLDIERDQSGGFLTSFPGELGLNLANQFDYMAAQFTMISWMNGSQNPSYLGQSGVNTVDGLPMFSENHQVLGRTQSNVVHGGLPATMSDINSQGYDSVAKILTNDLQNLTYRIKTLLNTNGSPVHPGLNLAKNVTFVFPPHLEPAARLAFQRGLIDATTTVGSQLAREVIAHGLYATVPDTLFGSGQPFQMPNIGAPNAPVVTQTAGGTLTAGTVYVVATWVGPYGECAASSVTTFSQTADYLLQVPTPASPTGVAGTTVPPLAEGFNVYIGTNASGPYYQQNTSLVPVGSTWAEPTSGLITTGNTPPTAATAVPNLENAYWAFVVNDYVWPGYVQLFNSLSRTQTFPTGDNEADMVDRLVNEYGLDYVQARTIGNAMIETTFGMQGSMAIPEVINKETFLFSGRLWASFVWGPWFNAFMVVPSNVSNPLPSIQMPFQYALAA